MGEYKISTSEIDYGQYFTEEEFYCHCGLCENIQMSQLLLDKLNLARDTACTSFVITSGYRCPTFNRELGAKKNSAHLSGLAADIACTDSKKRFVILEALQPYFSRIGIDKEFIHVDVDQSKPGEVLWVY